MDRREHHIRIISHKLVALSLLARIAGVEAGESICEGKMFNGEKSSQKKSMLSLLL